MKGEEMTPEKIIVPIPFPIALALSIKKESERRGTSFESCVVEMLEGTEKTVPMIVNRRA